jgi:hypothetical protein
MQFDCDGGHRWQGARAQGTCRRRRRLVAPSEVGLFKNVDPVYGEQHQPSAMEAGPGGRPNKRSTLRMMRWRQRLQATSYKLQARLHRRIESWRRHGRNRTSRQAAVCNRMQPRPRAATKRNAQSRRSSASNFAAGATKKKEGQGRSRQQRDEPLKSTAKQATWELLPPAAPCGRPLLTQGAGRYHREPTTRGSWVGWRQGASAAYIFLKARRLVIVIGSKCSKKQRGKRFY